MAPPAAAVHNVDGQIQPLEFLNDQIPHISRNGPARLKRQLLELTAGGFRNGDMYDFAFCVSHPYNSLNQIDYTLNQIFCK